MNPKPSEIKCDYCNQDGHDNHHCRKKIQRDVMQLVGHLEKSVAVPDQPVRLGINEHLCAVWGLRDSLNDYFSD